MLHACMRCRMRETKSAFFPMFFAFVFFAAALGAIDGRVPAVPEGRRRRRGGAGASRKFFEKTVDSKKNRD